MRWGRGGGKGRSTGLLRVGAFNTSSKLWTGADCGADCALLWGVTIRAPVRGFGGGGGLGADAGAETERGGGCANRSKFEATVRVWRSGFNISRIPVSWSTVIVGLKAINREANDWAAVGAAGGGVPPGGGALAGWLTTCGGTTAAATGGGMATWGGAITSGGRLASAGGGGGGAAGWALGRVICIWLRGKQVLQTERAYD